STSSPTRAPPWSTTYLARCPSTALQTWHRVGQPREWPTRLGSRSMTTTAPPIGPLVGAAGVTFRLADPHARLRGVRLHQEVRVPGDQLDFSYRRGVWSRYLRRPAVDRMEYLLELTFQ